MKKLLFLAIAAAVAFYLTKNPSGPSPVESARDSAETITKAYVNERGGSAMEGSGTVVKLLGDDSLGDRHQRFILRLPSGQTVLVAHNIDIAPRVEPLAVGDTVEFRGEYEPNDKGGVIHWTHHDPQGHHAAGWLKHGGRTFE